MSLINVVRAAFEKKQAAAAAEAAGGAHDDPSARCTQPPALMASGWRSLRRRRLRMLGPASRQSTTRLDRSAAMAGPCARELTILSATLGQAIRVSGVQPLTQAHKEFLMFILLMICLQVLGLPAVPAKGGAPDKRRPVRIHRQAGRRSCHRWHLTAGRRRRRGLEGAATAALPQHWAGPGTRLQVSVASRMAVWCPRWRHLWAG